MEELPRKETSTILAAGDRGEFNRSNAEKVDQSGGQSVILYKFLF